MGILIESDIPEGLLERWLQDKQALDAFVRDFQECRISMDAWTHRAHIGIASALILREGREAALHCIRLTIPRLNEAQGRVNTAETGYHETLTIFWVDRIAAMLARLPKHFTRLDRVRVAVEAYGGIRRLDRAYYSYDVLSSAEARREWRPPDSER